MEIIDVISKTKDFNIILKEAQKGSLSKSILLISKDNLYSFDMARLIASIILNNGEFIDNENYLRVVANSHPDLKIYPQKDKLLVSDSEEIVFESYASPIQGDKKVFIIKDFDNSMESAQNKLLKLLEEPPKNVFIILTCTNINLVLPTIRSRCNKFELGKINENVIKDFLKGEENEQLILSLCDGYLGRAEKLSKIKNLTSIFQSTISVLTKMSSSKDVLFYAKDLINNSQYFDLIMEILSIALEDIIAIKNNIPILRLPQIKDEFIKIKDNYTMKAICELQKVFDKAVKEKFYNVNRTTILENMLLNILEVKFICK